MARTETIEGLEVPSYKEYVNNKEIKKIIGRHTSIGRTPLFGRGRSKGQRLATSPLPQSRRDWDRHISRRNRDSWHMTNDGRYHQWRGRRQRRDDVGSLDATRTTRTRGRPIQRLRHLNFDVGNGRWRNWDNRRRWQNWAARHHQNIRQRGQWHRDVVQPHG